MKKSEAKPGTKVIATYEYGDEYGDDQPSVVPYGVDDYGDNTLIGVILNEEGSTGKVWVEWIEGKLSGEDDQELDLKVLSLESERSELDKEFLQTSKLVKQKMQEAAKLVNEAGKLVKPRRLERMYEAVRPLVNAMDSNGWRSSSWGC
jgi:hypothetical protein